MNWSGAKKLFDWLGTLGLPPLSLLILKLVGVFDLEPLPTWQFPAGPLALLVSVVGALLVQLSNKNMAKYKKRIFVVIAMVMSIICAAGYGYFRVNEAPVGLGVLFDLAACATFFGAYFTYGYCAAHVAKFLVNPE